MTQSSAPLSSMIINPCRTAIAQRFLNHLTNLLAKLLYHFTVDDNLQLAVGGAIFTIRSLDSCVPASASLQFS
jgi:hypothetical protein